nr:cysteine-rich, acidic integral membrane protein-like [Parasteatoda tepidariorum]
MPILRDTGATVDDVCQKYVSRDRMTGEHVWVKHIFDNHMICLLVAKIDVECDLGIITTKAVVVGNDLDQGCYLLGNETAPLFEQSGTNGGSKIETENFDDTKLDVEEEEVDIEEDEIGSNSQIIDVLPQSDKNDSILDIIKIDSKSSDRYDRGDCSISSDDSIDERENEGDLDIQDCPRGWIDLSDPGDLKESSDRYDRGDCSISSEDSIDERENEGDLDIQDCPRGWVDLSDPGDLKESSDRYDRGDCSISSDDSIDERENEGDLDIQDCPRGWVDLSDPGDLKEGSDLCDRGDCNIPSDDSENPDALNDSNDSEISGYLHGFADSKEASDSNESENFFSWDRMMLKVSKTGDDLKDCVISNGATDVQDLENMKNSFDHKDSKGTNYITNCGDYTDPDDNLALVQMTISDGLEALKNPDDHNDSGESKHSNDSDIHDSPTDRSNLSSPGGSKIMDESCAPDECEEFYDQNIPGDLKNPDALNDCEVKDDAHDAADNEMCGDSNDTEDFLFWVRKMRKIANDDDDFKECVDSNGATNSNCLENEKDVSSPNGTRDNTNYGDYNSLEDNLAWVQKILTILSGSGSCKNPDDQNNPCDFKPSDDSDIKDCSTGYVNLSGLGDPKETGDSCTLYDRKEFGDYTDSNALGNSSVLNDSNDHKISGYHQSDADPDELSDPNNPANFLSWVKMMRKIASDDDDYKDCVDSEGDIELSDRTNENGLFDYSGTNDNANNGGHCSLEENLEWVQMILKILNGTDDPHHS